MTVLVLVLFLVAVISTPVSAIWALVFLAATAVIPVVDVLLSILRIKTPLNIHTPDGSDEPFHPSVVFFEKAWNGYQYWMAFTPYPVNKPPYRDRWECPCVVASNDGVHWEYPGECSFLDDLTEEQIQSFDYFSDTHLTYDKCRDVLCCYYRLDEGEEPKSVTILRKETADGKTWSERIPLTYPKDVDALEPLSQSVVHYNGNFSMWYMAHRGDPNGIYVLHSADGLIWEGNQKCTLAGIKVTPWHIDVQYIDGCYYLTVYELTQRISLWTSLDGENFTFVKVLLTIPKFGNGGLFYNNILYRACLVKTGEDYKIYFACGSKKKNTVGLMTGRDVSSMHVVSASEKSNVKMLAYDMLSKYSYIERVIFRKIKMIVKR